MDIDYSYFTLTPKQKLNRYTNSKKQGVFLRINKKYFLEYFPWEVFGDVSSEELLEQIKISKKLPAFLGQLLELEKNKKNIQQANFKNHNLGKAVDCPVVKLKFLTNLVELENDIMETSAKIRLDFNNALSVSEFIEWQNHIPQFLKDKIEYIEDPCIFEDEDKIISSISLACDRNVWNENFYTYRIFKPNIDVYQKYSVPTIFSSYMGADLGRYHCYLALMKWGDLSQYHGIDTPNLYEGQLDIFHSEDSGIKHLDVKAVESIYKSLEEREWIHLI